MTCLSDSDVKYPEERVRPGHKIHCRITKINFKEFSVDLTSKSSDLMDRNRVEKDTFYDQPAEDAMLKAEKDSSSDSTTRSRSRSRSQEGDRDQTAHHSKSRDRSTRDHRVGHEINNRKTNRSRSRSPNPPRPSSLNPCGPRPGHPPIAPPPVVAELDEVLGAPGFDLPPVGAPAPPMNVPPPWFSRVQCYNFLLRGECPRGDHCYYVHGPYQPDRQLMEALDMPGRDPPQNPQQPPN
jgi:hypothetical protein